jgi:hypothetical protein
LTDVGSITFFASMAVFTAIFFIPMLVPRIRRHIFSD